MHVYPCMTCISYWYIYIIVFKIKIKFKKKNIDNRMLYREQSTFIKDKQENGIYDLKVADGVEKILS